MEKWQDKALLEIKKKMRIVDGRNISAEDYPEKRDCYPKLYKYITEHNPDYNGKICALYGLRRTGKTVMMNQCISELPPEEKEKSVYILKKPVICWKWSRCLMSYMKKESVFSL